MKPYMNALKIMPMSVKNSSWVVADEISPYQFKLSRRTLKLSFSRTIIHTRAKKARQIPNLSKSTTINTYITSLTIFLLKVLTRASFRSIIQKAAIGISTIKFKSIARNIDFQASFEFLCNVIIFVFTYSKSCIPYTSSRKYASISEHRPNVPANKYS